MKIHKTLAGTDGLKGLLQKAKNAQKYPIKELFLNNECTEKSIILRIAEPYKSNFSFFKRQGYVACFVSHNRFDYIVIDHDDVDNLVIERLK